MQFIIKTHELNNIENLNRPAAIVDKMTGTVHKLDEYDKVLKEFNETKQIYKRNGLEELYESNVFIDLSKQ